MEILDLIFKNKDGKTIRGKLYLPDIYKKYPVTIFAHGFGSDYRSIEHYGPMFAKQGIGMLLFDFCGGGPRCKSDGKMTEMSVLTELDDLLFILDKLENLGCVDMDNIFLMGESQGGYVVALAATKIPDRIKGLILWYPAFVLEQNAAEALAKKDGETCRLFGLEIGNIYNVDAVSVDIYRKIGKYKKKVLIVHGDEDYVVPVSASEKALGIYENARLHIIKGAGHGFNGDDVYEAARLSIDFVSDNLK